ncbi:MAG: hypothetical protein M9953_13910 [Thermomicrobiales bacterium]|nr:hypothetical protein [Thermomicrobiales bacterium]MCO5227158.1 hypothetical protein [Thermomicrobiales bacterium]
MGRGRLPSLRQANQVVVMKGGGIDAIGGLEDVLAKSAEIRTLWEEEGQESVND